MRKSNTATRGEETGKKVRAVMLSAMMVMSIVGGTAVFTGAAAAANASAAVNLADTTPGASTNHDWTMTSGSSGTLQTVYLNYSSTGTDLSSLSASDVAVEVDGSPQTVGSVGFKNGDVEEPIISLSSTVSVADGSSIVVKTTNDNIVNPSSSGTKSADIVLLDSGNSLIESAQTSFGIDDTTAPSLSNVALSESSGNMAISFDSDEQLGGSASDLSVSVAGPNGGSYTFDRTDFSESGSGSYTYSLSTTQAYDDGDGFYGANVTVAKDAAGNNGGTTGDGSGLTDTYDYSSGSNLPNAPYVNNTDRTHDPSTDTTLSVDYNATGQLTQSQIEIQVEDSTGTTIDFKSPSTTEGSVSLTVSGGTLSGDELLTYRLVNTDTGGTVASDDSWLNATGGDTTAPSLSNVALSESSGNMAISFDSDEQLGGSASDLSVSVAGPNGGSYTFDRTDFSESGSGPYAYSLSTTQAYDDGDGSYSATVTVAKDAAGNNGGTTGDGSGLTDTYDYSSGGGGTTGFLNGTVTDTNTGSGINGATVKVFSFATSSQTTTDSNGDYSFELSNGTYVVEVQKSGYIRRFRTEVTVSENQTTVENFTLGQGGTLSGQVTNATTGNSISGVDVMLDGPDVRFARTNTTGHYSTKVPAGNYTVTAFSNGDLTPNETKEVSVSSGGSATADLELISTGISNVSLSYLGGSGNPNMNKISADVQLTFGMAQIQLLNDNTNTGGMPNELEGLGVNADDRFEISFTSKGYDPNTLLWGAKNVSWESVDNGDGTYNVTIETETVHMEGINDRSLPIGPLQGQSPEEIAWPTGSDDKADLGWNRTVYFGLFDMSNLPAERVGSVEGMTIETNAQTFSRPRFVETNLPGGGTREELRVFVGGPNETVNGNKHDGFYNVFIPDDILSEWNVSDPETELDALYKGQNRNFDVNETADGAWLELDISYSSGQVEVGATPASNFTATVDETNSPVDEGETLTVNATIENVGTASDTQTVELQDFDGNTVDDQSVSLSVDETANVSLEWATQSDATGTVTVTTLDGDDTATVTVESTGGGGGSSEPTPINVGDDDDEGNATEETDDGTDDSDGEEAEGDESDSEGEGDTEPEIVVEEDTDDETDDGESQTEENQGSESDEESRDGESDEESAETDSLSVTVQGAAEQSTATIDESSTGRSSVGSTESVAVESISMNMAQGRDRASLTIRTFEQDVANQESADAAEVAAAARAFEETTGTVSAGYVDVDHDFESGDLDGVSFQFSARKSYLDDLGAEADDVRLYHSSDGEAWNEVETTQVGENETHYQFEGNAPSFSVFAIGTGADTLAVTTTERQTDSVTVGDEALVTARIENRGSLERDHEVLLTADGTTVVSESVTVAGGQSESVELAYTPEEAGEYDLAVNGESAGTLMVQQDEASVEETDETSEEDGGDSGTSLWPFVLVVLIVVGLAVIGYRMQAGDDDGLL